MRFVQVWSGAGQPWDNHDDLEAQHRAARRRLGPADRRLPRPTSSSAGCSTDTLVMWGGEFGRTPVAELPALSGRDHNHYGFSMCTLTQEGSPSCGTKVTPASRHALPPPLKPQPDFAHRRRRRAARLAAGTAVLRASPARLASPQRCRKIA